MQPESTIRASHITEDIPLNLDPSSDLWCSSEPVFFDRDNYGRQISGIGTTVHSCWSHNNLYLLFTCRYQELHLKPDPQTLHATDQLWNWDVAELFIGPEAHQTGRYKEFEISPQAEWLDLDIDIQAPKRFGDRSWASHLEAAAHIDGDAQIWYGAMRIPFVAITNASVKAGSAFRANLFRSQGPQHQLLAWQPSMRDTFHVPERFGELLLVE